MADLDDFFAKKDKKKSKGKKFTTADDIDKNLLESCKQRDKSKRGKLQLSTGYDGIDFSFGSQQDDEWRTIEEEEKKDNTGLKIQNLTIIESDCGEDDDGDWWKRSYSGEEGRDSEMEGSETGDLLPKKKVHFSPWKVVAQPQIQDEFSEMKPQDKKSEDEDTKSGTGREHTRDTGVRYVPPHVRNLAQKHTHFPGSRSLKTKDAPDVKSEELFPTLSSLKSTDPSNGAWDKKRRNDGIGFSKAHNSKSHSFQYSTTGMKTGPEKLTLINKYSALTNLTQNKN
ncbi:protein CDV3 homolog [Lycorma delicatula]|uniref:protein CDV3 homolog n=1 Tax=Lycorma delicatula TaxID=130591 RepID=UPI003F51A1FC